MTIKYFVMHLSVKNTAAKPSKTVPLTECSSMTAIKCRILNIYFYWNRNHWRPTMGATPVQPLLISTLNRRIRWIGFEIRNKEKNRELKFFNDISFFWYFYIVNPVLSLKILIMGTRPQFTISCVLNNELGRRKNEWEKKF